MNQSLQSLHFIINLKGMVEMSYLMKGGGRRPWPNFWFKSFNFFLAARLIRDLIPFNDL